MACVKALSSSSIVRAFASRKELLSFALLDGAEVRRVGCQPQHLCAAPCGHLLDAARSVRSQVVEHHHVAPSQPWSQRPLQVGVEAERIARALDGEHRHQPAQSPIAPMTEVCEP